MINLSEALVGITGTNSSNLTASLVQDIEDGLFAGSSYFADFFEGFACHSVADDLLLSVSELGSTEQVRPFFLQEIELAGGRWRQKKLGVALVRRAELAAK